MFQTSYMENIEQVLAAKKPATVGSSNCGPDCAKKTNSSKAHCGKTHSLKELMKTGIDIDHFYLSKWQLDSLAEYIYNEYHQYYYNQERVITEQIQNITEHAGKNYPEIHRIEALYSNLKNELGSHLLLEEGMLFPHIKNMVQAKKDGDTALASGIKHLAKPVNVMQDEHIAIEEILDEIRLISNNYSPAFNASADLRLLYKNLKALHENVKQHIFIENNILYPKAIQLESELKKPGLI